MAQNYTFSDVSGITENKLSKNHSVRSDNTVNNLKMLRNADVCGCDADELIDLRNVKTNRKMPLDRRADDFIEKVGNPYLFKVDDIVVKVEFGNGKDFSEILTDVILAG